MRSWERNGVVRILLGLLLILPWRIAVAQSPQVLLEYSGSYSCVQGLTKLTLRILKPTSVSDPNVIFAFGPDILNPRVPNGEYWGQDSFSANGSRFTLTPVRWIAQPPGYIMVGLEGVSSDGGATLEGQVVGGLGCTTFSVHLVYASAAVQPRGPMPPSQRPTEAPARTGASRVEVPLQMHGGVFVVPVQINGALTLDFMIDSGASDVSIPADVVLTLVRTGTLQASDFMGTQQYRLADGSTIPSATFRIRTLRVAGREVRDVTGSVAPVDGALLLGQSFLSRFSSWSINNQRRMLVLE
jgi:clan AA aspartic protease (TIGR02281 family)